VIENFLQPVEQLVNRIIAMDPDAQARLHRLAGKVIVVDALNTDFTCYVLLQPDQLRIGLDSPGREDLCIRGTPANLLAYIIAARSGSEEATHDLEVVGDVGLAQLLTGILRQFEPDWEEPLSYWIGDFAARKTGNLFRSAAGSARYARKSMEADFGEFMKFESELLPDRFEVDRLYASVDSLRDDVDRLGVRITRIARHLKEGVEQ